MVRSRLVVARVGCGVVRDRRTIVRGSRTKRAPAGGFAERLAGDLQVAEAELPAGEKPFGDAEDAWRGVGPAAFKFVGDAAQFDWTGDHPVESAAVGRGWDGVAAVFRA